MKTALLLLFVSLPANAGSIVTVSTSVLGGSGCFRTDSVSASCQSMGVDYLGHQLFASASATSTFGRYVGEMFGSVDLSRPPYLFYSAFASVSVTDMLTIAGPNGSGYLRVNHVYQSSLFAFPRVFFTVNGTDVPVPFSSIDFDVPITFGQAFPFLLDFRVGACDTDGCFGSLNFSSFSILDSNRNPISGYTYSSQDHLAYTFVGGLAVDTPEPATGWLAAVALCLLLILNFQNYRHH
jgi:hypothetical protein